MIHQSHWCDKFTNEAVFGWLQLSSLMLLVLGLKMKAAHREMHPPLSSQCNISLCLSRAFILYLCHNGE